MEHNPRCGNGSKRLRNVYRIGYATPDENPFMRTVHITAPFSAHNFVSPQFVEAILKICASLFCFCLTKIELTFVFEGKLNFNCCKCIQKVLLKFLLKIFFRDAQKPFTEAPIVNILLIF